MAAVAILSHENCLEILQRWKRDGPTKEEKDEFTLTALAQLNDPNELIQEDILQAAEMAESIDKIFTEVRKQLMLLDWGIQLGARYIPKIVVEWTGYQQRWRQCLRRSCDVAAENIDILRRFDNVYLEKIENIQTEQDRIEAIEALEPFIAELETDQSAAMTQEFLTLQRDIEAFIDSFDETVPELSPRKEIGVLDEQIESAQGALGITRGSLLDILGLGARASSVVASLKAQRNKKAENLRELHLAIKALNKLQAPQPQSEFASYQVEEPGIEELLKYLGIFTKIWASVRSYTVQFREHLKGGLEASTNTRFKAEVKAARSVCTPLMESLAAYIADLERWISS